MPLFAEPTRFLLALGRAQASPGLLASLSREVCSLAVSAQLEWEWKRPRHLAM